ncbi:hypothetical protein C8F04DRAFT_480855, partial [Mycena alexandri]
LHPSLHILGGWCVGTPHCTATLSSRSACALHVLRCMQGLNIFQSHHGHSAGWAIFFSPLKAANPNPNYIPA